MRITSFSSNISNEIKKDSIVLITSDQLKYANLIFVEHKKLLEETNLLNQQINNYQEKTDNLLKVDSLRVIQLENYHKQIEDLNKTIKKKNRVINCWKIGSISAGIILFLFLK